MIRRSGTESGRRDLGYRRRSVRRGDRILSALFAGGLQGFCYLFLARGRRVGSRTAVGFAPFLANLWARLSVEHPVEPGHQSVRRGAVHLWHDRQLDDRPRARRRHRGHGRGLSRRVRPAPVGGRTRHADRAAGGGAEHRLRALGPVRAGADRQRLDRSGIAGRLRLPAVLSGHDLRRQHADGGAAS